MQQYNKYVNTNKYKLIYTTALCKIYYYDKLSKN